MKTLKLLMLGLIVTCFSLVTACHTVHYTAHGVAKDMNVVTSTVTKSVSGPAHKHTVKHSNKVSTVKTTKSHPTY